MTSEVSERWLEREGLQIRAELGGLCATSDEGWYRTSVLASAISPLIDCKELSHCSTKDDDEDAPEEDESEGDEEQQQVDFQSFARLFKGPDLERGRVKGLKVSSDVRHANDPSRPVT